jgi:hydrogenase small subunit
MWQNLQVTKRRQVVTMAVTLYWLQCGGCGGDTHSFINAEAPNAVELFEMLDIDLLWHPTLSNQNHVEQRALTERILNDEQPLDILCVEGSIIHGPMGSGMFDTVHGKPKKDLVAALAKKAKFVLAIGTCASFGGFGTDGEIESTGMQFLGSDEDGLFDKSFKSGSGLPVINLSGCPCHPGVIVGTLSTLLSGADMPLDKYNRPLSWYGTTIHQGCTRNEHHEYRVEEMEFGEKGCLFFYLGCHGPLVYGPCNKVLWNRRSSKTRVGVPCFGCTHPGFPQSYPFFQTRNIEGIPIQLPDGVGRAHYMAYKGMAAAAAPKRLKEKG